MSADALPDLLERALRSLPPGALLVGYSGGGDSTALLHALAQSPAARARGLRALHVDHGLQAASPHWAAHCQVQAAAWGVDCVVVRAEVDRASGLGPEGAARQARYRAFASVQRADEFLLLAQHREDQAETLLLRLLRQSSSAAAAGMRPWRALPGTRGLWRPLLGVDRATLRDYLQRRQLDWIEDPSNAQLDYRRNFLRQRILPALAEHWPDAAATLAGSAELLAADADALAGLTAQQWAACRTLDPQVLALPALAALPADARQRVLRAWLAALALPLPPRGVMQRIQDELLGAAGTPARPGDHAAVAWRTVRLIRYRDGLYAGPPRAAAVPATRPWDARQPAELDDGSVWRLLPAAAQDLGWTLAPRRGGERIHLPGRAQATTLKQALQSHAIPPWERERLVLLWAADGELLAAGDLLLSTRMDAWLRQQQSRLQIDRGSAVVRPRTDESPPNS